MLLPSRIFPLVAMAGRRPSCFRLMATGESGYHVPVLCEETRDWLITDPAGTYADGTLGGGGHSAALLEVLAPAGGHLIAVDRDPDALASAGARLAQHTEAGRCSLMRATFGSLGQALRDGGAAAPLDGLLLDLGVSSFQLDEPGRGFSYMRDGPLDMRMDAAADGALTAAQIVNEWPEAALADVLWRHGEERESRRLARAIGRARPLATTLELVAVLTKAGSRREPKEV